jgi:putative heme-binding domain-containing protein
VIPNIVWQNLHPMLDSPRVLDAFLATAMANPSSPAEAALLERMVEKLLALQSKPEVLGKLLSLLIKDGHQQTARQICSALAQKIQTGEIRQNQLQEFRKGLESIVNSQPHSEMMALRATWGDSEAIEKITVVVRDNKGSEQSRGMAFEALVIAAPASAVNVAVPMLKEAGVPVSVKASLLSSLGRVADPTLSKTLLDMYSKADPNLQPRMIEFLSQRKAWANDLLDAIESKKIPKEALGMNQARRIVAERDPKLRQKLEKVWGAVREGRNQVRDQITSEMRDLIVKTPGDAKAGRIVFNKVCGQCHKMHGEGQEVGPDITVNGRASFEQLLSNVFDPSLVIGADYQAVTVSTTKGRVLTGLLVEDSKERISLKVQGGKIEIVPRAEVEEMQRSKVSLMPEGLEKQIPTNEIRDLFAYLLLDKPPEDPKAKKIPGAP